MKISPLMVETLVAALEDVFETMVFAEVQVLPVREGIHPAPKSHVVATIGFTGEQCGVVSLHTGTDAAQQIAGAMLGIPASSVNGEMPDAIGEVANMVAGTFRTKMAAFEQAWAISMPTVTIGSDFLTRYSPPVSRIVVPFTMSGHDLFLELVVHG